MQKSLLPRDNDQESDDANDPDCITNNQLNKEKSTISKIKVKTLKLFSVITGAETANRRKVFYDVQSSADMKIWTVTVHGTTTTCAKIVNPAILWSRSFEDMTKFKRVQRLELEDPEGFLTSLPKSVVSDMTELDSFSLTWTRIKFLPANIFHSRLKFLYIQRNHITHLNGIEKSNNLKILNSSHNNISALPKNFGQLVNLTELNLSANYLVELPESICLLRNLKSLDCSCNRLQCLPLNIGHLIRLSTLDVSVNQLACFPKTIGNLPELIDLRVSANNLSDLPDTFSQLSRLNSLILRKNKFVKVPRGLGELINLQHLNMKDNELYEFDVFIPSLKQLNLDGNQFKCISPIILQMKNLQILSLQNNKIFDIPKNIGLLQSLKTLHLSSNEISVIPNEIRNLNALKHLGLKQTSITNLPKVICDMSNLTYICLDECSKLEAYLNIAYKNNGIEGIKNYLNDDKENENEENSAAESESKDSSEKTKMNIKRTLIVDRRSTKVETIHPGLMNDQATFALRNRSDKRESMFPEGMDDRESAKKQIESGKKVREKLKQPEIVLKQIIDID